MIKTSLKLVPLDLSKKTVKELSEFVIKSNSGNSSRIDFAIKLLMKVVLEEIESNKFSNGRESMKDFYKLLNVIYSNDLAFLGMNIAINDSQ